MSFAIGNIVPLGFTCNFQRSFVVSLCKGRQSVCRRFVPVVIPVNLPNPCVQPQRLPIDIQVSAVNFCGKFVIPCARHFWIVQRMNCHCNKQHRRKRQKNPCGTHICLTQGTASFYSAGLSADYGTIAVLISLRRFISFSKTRLSS